MWDVPPFEIKNEIALAGNEAQFEGCARFLERYLEQTQSVLRRIAYTHSKTWGYVLRADYARSESSGGSEGTIICWTIDGSAEVQFAVDVEGRVNDLGPTTDF